VLKTARQVDFWDTEGLARSILDLLADPAGAAALAESVRAEAEAVRWQAAAETIDGIYRLLHPR
jgi:hypothetical protein